MEINLLKAKAEAENLLEDLGLLKVPCVCRRSMSKNWQY